MSEIVRVTGLVPKDHHGSYGMGYKWSRSDSRTCSRIKSTLWDDSLFDADHSVVWYMRCRCSIQNTIGPYRQTRKHWRWQTRATRKHADNAPIRRENKLQTSYSASESQKVLYQPGKNYYKLKVFTGCRQCTDFTDEPFIKFVVGISSYKQFSALSDNIGSLRPVVLPLQFEWACCWRMKLLLITNIV